MTGVREALQEVIDATDELIESLHDHREFGREAIGRLDDGQDLPTVRARPPAAVRERTQVAQKTMDMTRSRMRDVVMQACIDAGMTTRDIAKEWGVSRQLVERHTSPAARARVAGR